MVYVFVFVCFITLYTLIMNKYKISSESKKMLDDMGITQNKMDIYQDTDSLNDPLNDPLDDSLDDQLDDSLNDSLDDESLNNSIYDGTYYETYDKTYTETYEKKQK